MPQGLPVDSFLVCNTPGNPDTVLLIFQMIELAWGTTEINSSVPSLDFPGDKDLTRLCPVLSGSASRPKLAGRLPGKPWLYNRHPRALVHPCSED